MGEFKSSDEQNAKSASISSLAELVRRLELPDSVASEAREADRLFPTVVPNAIFDRISRKNRLDPILLQFLPRPEELAMVPGFSADPLGEFPEDGSTDLSCRTDSRSLGGPSPILRKYFGRALILTGGACAGHCRFCFRRHQPPETPLFYSEDGRDFDDQAITERLAALLRPLAEDASIREVILSGGDPIGLSDRRIEILLDYIQNLPSVNRVRIHTRFPVLVPERVTERLLTLFAPDKWVNIRPVFVFHVNHPSEVGAETAAMFRRFSALGVPLLSQTVLLRGVNDSAATLIRLMERLGDCGVIPYYLHQLDRVAGAAHFEVPVEEGRILLRELRGRLPGWLVPRYVREIPGALAKVPIE